MLSNIILFIHKSGDNDGTLFTGFEENKVTVAS